MQSDFKSFAMTKFENVKIKGMYEWQMKPLELIVNVTFSVLPTSKAIDLADFHSELKRQLSLFTVDREIKTLDLEGWKFDGSRYTYGHDYTSIRAEQNRVSSLGIDLYFIQADENTNIESFYQSIISKIAEIGSFQSSDFFVIRPHRKNAKL